MLSNIKYKDAGFKEPSYDGALVDKNEDGYIGYIIVNDIKRWVSYSSNGDCHHIMTSNNGSAILKIDNYDLERIEPNPVVVVKEEKKEEKKEIVPSYYEERKERKIARGIMVGVVNEVLTSETDTVLGCAFDLTNIRPGDEILIYRNFKEISKETVKGIKRFNEELESTPRDTQCGIFLEDKMLDESDKVEFKPGDMIIEILTNGKRHNINYKEIICPIK